MKHGAKDKFSQGQDKPTCGVHHVRTHMQSCMHMQELGRKSQ